MKQCPCGKNFTPKHSTHRCCDACKASAARRRNRERIGKTPQRPQWLEPELGGLNLRGEIRKALAQENLILSHDNPYQPQGSREVGHPFRWDPELDGTVGRGEQLREIFRLLDELVSRPGTRTQRSRKKRLIKDGVKRSLILYTHQAYGWGPREMGRRLPGVTHSTASRTLKGAQMYQAELDQLKTEVAETKAEVVRIGQWFPSPIQEAENYASESGRDAVLGHGDGRSEGE